MKRYLVALLVVLGVVGLLGVLAVRTGFANDENASRAKCSEATLKGTYLFAQDGVNLTGNDQVPFAIAGYQVYNGNGKVRGVQSGNFGGQVFRKEPFTGTYTVKADCIATVTYNGGEPVVYDQFVAPDGSKFTFVQVKPPEDVTSAFEVRGSAKRVAQ
jgi:type II secretory pathway pseudopilin PulG